MSSSLMLISTSAPVPSSFTVYLITQSIMSRKRKLDIVHPCLTPLVSSNHSEVASSSTTAHPKQPHSALTMLMIFCGIPYRFIIMHKPFLCTESNAFSKSVKLIKRVACHLFTCSNLLSKMKICSVVPLPDSNPACSLRSLQSILVRMRSITILSNIFLTTGGIVTPRQFLHSFKLPFFGILIMSPLFYLSRTLSRLRIVPISSFTLSVVNSRSAFKSFAVIISSPRALPFMIVFIALLISALLTGPVSMSAMSFFIDRVGCFLPFKYLHEMLSLPLPLSSLLVKALPFLSLTTVLYLGFSLQIVLVKL